MELTIQHQEKYSRLEILFRTFFGLFYIAIPHGLLLFFYLIYAGFLHFFATILALFTGSYAKVAFDTIVGLIRWQTRVSASITNLVDGYPPFGPNAEWNKVNFEVKYNSKISRFKIIIILLFGYFLLIPHFFFLMILTIPVYFILLLSFFVVLFTGKYPEGIHKFMVGFNRYSVRLTLYFLYLYPTYPPFSLEKTESDDKF
jgi:hypothetical protein